MIEVDAVVGGKSVKFKFMDVTPEKIAEWASKAQARQSRVEILSKRIEILEKAPIEDQDDEVILSMKDRHAVAFTKLIEYSTNMLGWIIEPGMIDARRLIVEHTEDMHKVFDTLFSRIIPSEGDQKK